MGVLIVGDDFLCTGYNVEMTVLTYSEPGVTAVMEGFGDCIDLYNVSVESRAFLKVKYIKRNMI